MSGTCSNYIKLRQYNERFVLDALRHQREASKSDLARVAHLTPLRLPISLTGWSRQVGKRLGKRGPPSLLYALNPTRPYSIGIKIGRRAMEAVMLDFTGEICARMEQEYDFPDPIRSGSGVLTMPPSRIFVPRPAGRQAP